jgi:HK97 family phage major capsid protein
MTINELREKRNATIKACRQFLDSHRTERGTLTAEDDATYSKMEQEVTDLGKEIARLERQEALDMELSKPTSTPITNTPGAMNEKKGRATAEYRDAMLKALRSNFRQISNVLQEGIDASGGYLVPEEYDQRLIEILNEENIVRALATVIPTSGEHKINIAATTPAAAWIDEGEALTFGDATFAQKNLDAHKLHVAVKVTEELLYDNAG